MCFPLLQKSHRKSSIPQDAIVPSKKATATSKHVNRKSDDTSMDIDQDVALLTAEFSRSLHCIPKNISFGRRSQGSFSKSFNTSK